MALHSRIATLNEFYKVGLVAVFYNPEPSVALEIAKACLRAGVTTLEFTNRGDGAFLVFEKVLKELRREHPEAVVGIGSVVDQATASLYINLGADFIIGPCFSEDIARCCNLRKVPYIPGVASMSDIVTALEYGSEIVKLFPGAECGGPKFIKNALGPCPWASIMPTGGVDTSLESLREWFKAGACCVGMGSKLINKDLVREKKFDAITEHVTNVMNNIAKIRQELA